MGRKKKATVHQQLTPYQGTKRTFGYFKCEDCENEWASAYSWANKGQECVECQRMIYPHTQRPLERSAKKHQKRHLSEHCEMCIDLGRLCQTQKHQNKLQKKNGCKG